MASPDSFRATVVSLGEWTLDNLKGTVPFTHIQVLADPSLGFARLTLTLDPDTWENRSAALDKLAEVRIMFLDELALEFSFEECLSEDPSAAYPVLESVFA